MFYLPNLIPFRRRIPSVAVVFMTGVIGSIGVMRRGLNLQTMGPVLEAAFTNRKTVAVCVIMNSPGGSPVQSDLLQQRIRDLAREHEKPVFVFCEDVVASGGYWIALAANEIYANASSIIGSIGVISAGFGFEEAIGKLGIERRSYSTGPKKGMLDPFQAEDPQHVAHLKSLQHEIFERFCEWVRDRRGVKLKGPENELFSGAFWTGSKAMELGLIDGIGDMRTIMRERYGQKVRFRAYAVREGLLRRLGLKSYNAAYNQDVQNHLNNPIVHWTEDLMASIETRAFWSRFGL